MSEKFSHKKWKYAVDLWHNKAEKSEDKPCSDDEAVRYIGNYFRCRRVALGSEEREADINEAWGKISKEISKNKRVSSGRTILRYAAVLIPALLIITAGIYMLGNKDNSKVITANILPGEKKAQLILASGESIEVGRNREGVNLLQSGTTLRSDESGEKLIYSKKTSVPNKEVAYNILKVPKGGEFYLELSDGSGIWLNSETTIKYPVSFTGNIRKVFLRGEAYFNIKKDSLCPFIVHSDCIDIKVLGTSFNVSSYPKDNKVHTTLVSGSVEVSKGSKKYVLSPSLQYTYNKMTRQDSVKQVDTDLFTSWVNGKFYFKGFRFEEVVTKLERWYDFEMFYMNESVKDMKFRGVINKDKPIADVLRKLEKTADISFIIKNKTIIVNRKSK